MIPILLPHKDIKVSKAEWRAFRLLFFPMSVARECDPADLRQLQRMIEKALDETKQTNNEKEKST